ncbi:MAG: hypothetical protein BGP06_15770 [Rhizobiales bacterium 65-9]|nr:MAG: hypothetical protein BGP06_15770 [Rhizobiales bacterium 65-9]
MRKSVTLIAAASVAAAFGFEAAAHDHTVPRGRLIFADHEKPVVSILDLDTFQVTHRFDVPKPNPVLTMAEGGRYVVIKTGDDAGTVRLLDTGLIRESHGDHDDIDKAAPKMLDLSLSGERPAHVVSDEGWLAVFFDGPRPWEKRVDARAVLLKLNSLDKAQPIRDEWVGQGPQHGIAIPLGRNQWLISVPKEAYVRGEDRSVSSRPDGFQILERKDKAWRTVASFNDAANKERSCKEFHGHASLDGAHAFGCHQTIAGDERSDGGVLIVEKTGGRWSSRKLGYPDARRASTIKAREASTHMVANYGLKGPYNAFLRIDPKAKTLTAADVFAVPDNQPICQYEIARDGKRVANLTPDGKLRIHEIAPAWRQVASFDAVPAFDCQYGAATPTPSLAIVGDSAFVSDPVNRRIREFHISTLAAGLDAPVDGMPANLATAD